jgi:hypothetical protein
MVKGADDMTSKSTGLAAFTRKNTAVQSEPVSAPATPTAPVLGTRRRGKGEIVSLTVRLRRADWERLHQLATAEGTSIQQLAVQGLSRIFIERGLPGLTE